MPVNNTNTTLAKKLLALSAAFCLSTSLFGGDFFEDEIVEKKEIAQTLDDQGKQPLTFKKGDIQATFGGKLKVEHYHHNNMNYLNSKLPDEYGAFKHTIDLTLDLVYGKEKFGHNAFEAFLDLKSKSKWGVAGSYKSTTPTEISVADTSLGEHEHRTSRPIPWVKDAWMQFSFNSAFNLKTETLHFLKFGYFPFQLGRGIALGSFYATVYEDLGLFSYSADSSAPGINFHGDILKDKLSYDLYYSKIEDNSSTIADTLNTNKKNHIGRSATPWSGVAKDDELWAARLQWKAIDHEKFGHLEVEPYIYYNEASDQKVEFKNDCKTKLGSYGLSAAYNKNNLEIGAEVAFNYGSENLYAIDRNQIKTRRNNDGSLVEYYSHVLGNVNGDKVLVSYDNKTNVDGYIGSTNNGEIATNLYNASDRFRPAYKNDFTGWMGIIDAAYQFEKCNVKLSTEYGYASGDGNPHKDEVNKNYGAFIGLHELYNGKNVKSILVLGERQVVQPLSIRQGDTGEIGSNTAFSDIHYFGLGANWKPESFKNNKLEVKPNLMLFWKADDSLKNEYESLTSREKASHFMGTEFNLVGGYELLKDLTLEGAFAVFVPGSYYKDIKGAKIPSKDIYSQLPTHVQNQVNPKDYRLSDDTAFYTNVSITYKF
jgi:hypothetical protein